MSTISNPGRLALGSAGEALAHVINCATDDPDHPAVDSIEGGALLNTHLASLGWHLVQADATQGFTATVISEGEVIVHVPFGGRGVAVGPNEDVVRIRTDQDAELDALTAMARVLDTQPLDQTERRRITAYLAERYAGTEDDDFDA